MSLKKWRNNNRKIYTYIHEYIQGKHEISEESSEDAIHASLKLNPDEENENKVLGIPWTTKNEFLISFTIQTLTKNFITNRAAEKDSFNI